ncbi:hypothetical protein INR49_021598 [Caranx melampygus]|nr:hypothetical protein INR49_021598 [Caranx melampygus]
MFREMIKRAVDYKQNPSDFMDEVMQELEPSNIFQPVVCSFNVHAMSNSRHSQFCKVILGKSWEVRAFDLVFLKPCSVLPQIDALQPVSNIILIPEVEGFLVEGPKG